MKKAILAVLALASVVACNKSEVLEVAPQKAISFENPFVDNSTKAIDGTFTGSNTPESFNVYGTLTNATGQVANIFNGVEVKRSLEDGEMEEDFIYGTGTWYYADDAVQYWMPGNTYNFTAVVNGVVATNDNGMPKTIGYTVADQTDLLYATSGSIVCDGTQSNVAFTLGHLLTKVKFNFTNEYPAATNFVVKIDNVSIVNAAGSGVYTVGEQTPWAPGADAALSFGPVVAENETDSKTEGVYMEHDKTYSSNNVKLLVPESQVWQIAFTANVYYYDGANYTLVKTYDYTTTPLNSGTAALNLEAGKSYNFNIAIGQGLTPITFSATTTEWVAGADQPITVQ